MRYRSLTRSTLAYTLVAVVLICASSCSVSHAASKPHIVFILVDDMGYGDAGCYNANSKIPTPNIDSLARDGMRFTDAHASGPLCHLSRYGLMTGCYPFRTNVGVWRKQPVIKENQATVPSVLQQQGYRTAMVGKWHLGFAENGYTEPLPGGPVDRGFDSYFGIRASTDIPPYFYIRGNRAVQPPTNKIDDNRSEGWSPIQGAFWRAGGIAPDMKLKDVLPRFTDEAIDVIESHAAKKDEQPLMLYLAYPAPHTPWLPSAEFDGRSKASMYGDFTCMVDHMVGRVLKSLEKAGIADNCIVVFSSDNGPVWYDKDVERFDHDSSGGLRGMKSDAWEGGHRMPFLVRWPETVEPGSTSHQTISFVDVLATVAELTEADLKADDGPDSFSFLSVLKGTQPADQPTRPSLALRSGGGLMTLRRGPWKLIDALGSGGFSRPSKRKPEKGEPVGQLYNLDKDLDESDNLYDQHPEIVEELRTEMKRIVTADRSRP